MAECSLCSASLPKNPIVDGESHFCCSGCHAVHQILSAQGELGEGRDHPLFQEALAAGVISHAELLEPESSEEIALLHLEIGEMWCPSCAQLIHLILERREGVITASVDYATDLALIRYNPRRIGSEAIEQQISRLGYRPSRIEEAEGRAKSRSLLLRIGICGLCLLNLMMFAYPTYVGSGDGGADYYDQLGKISFWFAVPALLYCGWPIYRRAFVALRARLIGMEALVTVAVWSSFALSLFGSGVYYDSMTAVIFFVLLGRWIEQRAKKSVRTTLAGIARSLPKRARRRTGSGDAMCPIKEVELGDLLVAYRGEKIALDGEVVEGEGGCDESLITGESIPVAKREGSSLVGGSVLACGSLVYRVTRVGEESTLHRIAHMVQFDLPHRKEAPRLVDRIASWLVPLVLVLALLLCIDPMRSLAVLLVACPCAIGIAVPLTEALLIRRFAALGALVRNRRCLAYLGREDHIFFDKTGTITEGRFTVEQLPEEYLRELKGLASCSIHPVSVAIAGAIEGEAKQLEQIEERAGQGMVGWSGGREFRLGSAELVGHKVRGVGFSVDGQLIADLRLGDRLRSGIPQMVAEIECPCTLLSGDSQEAVAKVATHSGLYRWKARCSPMEKREAVKAGGIVCMVGDGINDGPALSAAHVAISLTSAADISMGVSDLLLTRGNMSCLPALRSLACRGRQIARQNLTWAFSYNAIGLALALIGWLTPLASALLMVASSLFVTLNTLRISASSHCPALFSERELLVDGATCPATSS